MIMFFAVLTIRGTYPAFSGEVLILLKYQGIVQHLNQKC